MHPFDTTPRGPKSSHGSAIISENEVHGQRFGFKGRYQAVPVRPVKLYVGIDVDTANYIGFPLLEHVNTSILSNLCQSIGGGTVTLLGRGIDETEEPLHVFIKMREHSQVEQASTRVDTLLKKVRNAFEKHQTQILVGVAQLAPHTRHVQNGFIRVPTIDGVYFKDGVDRSSIASLRDTDSVEVEESIFILDDYDPEAAMR